MPNPIPGLTRFWQDSRASVSYKVQGGSLPPRLRPGCAALSPSRHERELRISPSKAPSAAEARPPCPLFAQVKCCGEFA